MHFLRRFRPINLFIVLLTQVLVHEVVIKPILIKRDIETLPFWFLGTVLLVTLIVCAAGYVINDILDKDIDLINKPEKAIENTKLWYGIYAGLLVFGFMLMVLITLHVQHAYFLFIYIASFIILYLYSAYFKCMPLLGNLVVSLFSASVILVILAPYYPELDRTYGTHDIQLILPLMYYFVFAFFASLIREIVKDLEDETGDKQQNCNTISVALGRERTKFFALLITLFFVGLFIFWQYLYAYTMPVWLLILFNILVSAPFLYIVYLLDKARNTEDFHRISQIIKVLMLLGIVLVFLI